MIEPTTITAAITSVKTLYDIGSSLLKADKDLEVKAKSVELLSAIADMQGKLIAAQQNMSELQEELRQANDRLNRNADLERYELVEPYQGTRLYRLKADARRDGEPNHYICPNCRDVLGKLSVLQEGEHCAICKNKECGQVYDLADFSAPPRPSFSGY